MITNFVRNAIEYINVFFKKKEPNIIILVCLFNNNTLKYNETVDIFLNVNLLSKKESVNF